MRAGREALDKEITLSATKQGQRRLNRPARGLCVLRTEVFVPKPIQEVFAFFSDARNLERLTPPWVGFRILTPTPIEMRAGALIDYRIRVRGVPLRWRTAITVWEPPFRFVDLQLRGPYVWWHHEHRFEAEAGGTRVMDTVEYKAPLAWLSHPLLVSRDVSRIFAYRSELLPRLIGPSPAPAHSPSTSGV